MDTTEESLRHVAAGLMAQDIVVGFLLRMWLKQLPPAGQAEIIDALRAAMQRTDTLRGNRDDFDAERLSDIAVLAQEKLEYLLKRAAGA